MHPQTHCPQSQPSFTFSQCDVLEYYDARVRSVSTEFYLPAVLRARTYLHRPNRMVRMTLNRRSIMLRDKHTCQYCGSRENLTLDHIVPASKVGQGRGGDDHEAGPALLHGQLLGAAGANVG